MDFLKKFFKKAPKQEMYMQVFDKIGDIIVLNKIGTPDERTISLDIADLPENVFKCSAYKITIEPIEHTFAKPCNEWKKTYKPKSVDFNEQKVKMFKMFGLVEDE